MCWAVERCCCCWLCWCCYCCCGSVQTEAAGIWPVSLVLVNLTDIWQDIRSSVVQHTWCTRAHFNFTRHLSRSGWRLLVFPQSSPGDHSTDQDNTENRDDEHAENTHGQDDKVFQFEVHDPAHLPGSLYQDSVVSWHHTCHILCFAVKCSIPQWTDLRNCQNTPEKMWR